MPEFGLISIAYIVGAVFAIIELGLTAYRTSAPLTTPVPLLLST